MPVMLEEKYGDVFKNYIEILNRIKILSKDFDIMLMLM